MTDEFKNLMRQIEDEAQAEGPHAGAELRALDAQFKIAADLLGRRLDLAMSQSALSKLSGVPHVDVSQIESARGNPTVATIEKLMSAMGGGSIEISWNAL